jgi:CspA family cold shock protein
MKGGTVDLINKSIKNTMNGTIKTKTDRGFGFISRDGEAKDLFFHSSDLSGVTFDELQAGAAVTFDVEDGEKGPRAKNVKLA